MTFHSLADERRRPVHAVSRNGLVNLGWPHFWLLISILGAFLGLAVLVFYVHLLTL